MIHPTAVIGDLPEARDHHGPGMGTEIHETARIGAFVTVDSGVSSKTHVGARTWLMKKVHIGHDAFIGDDVEIAPLTSVGGYVRIDDYVKVGQGVVFKPRVRVGARAVIGTGAVVTKDVPAGETWVGNPARQLVHTKPPMTPSEEEGWDEWATWWDNSRRQ